MLSLSGLSLNELFAVSAIVNGVTSFVIASVALSSTSRSPRRTDTPVSARPLSGAWSATLGIAALQQRKEHRGADESGHRSERHGADRGNQAHGDVAY